jgi:hypothetical protein
MKFSPHVSQKNSSSSHPSHQNGIKLWTVARLIAIQTSTMSYFTAQFTKALCVIVKIDFHTVDDHG